MRGQDLSHNEPSGRSIWLDNATLQQRIALKKRLLALSIAEYGRERGGYLQSDAPRLGITIWVASTYHADIMRASLAAELEALDAVFAREGGQRVAHPHPDTIPGPWRRRPEQNQGASVVTSVSDTTRGCGKSLHDCIAEWIRDRVRLCKHPDADVLCFRVTTAGGRAIKAYSRERDVPVRTELISLGLPQLVDDARRKGWRTLWQAVEDRSGNISTVSNYFSAFWGDITNNKVGINDEQKSLYSFRHSFKDALDRGKISLEIKQDLMGHSDPGTTGRYGAKRQPKPVDIKALRRAIQKLDWNFLASIKAPVGSQ